MIKETFKATTAFKISSEVLYNSSLSSSVYTKFSGNKTMIKPVVGSIINACCGHIFTKLIELKPFEKISNHLGLEISHQTILILL